MRFAVAAAVCAVLAASAPPAHAANARDLVDGLTALSGRLTGTLSAADRAAVHAAKAKLIAAHYGAAVKGVTYADVLSRLDCVSTLLQRARAAPPAGARSLAARAGSCYRRLAAQLSGGGAASRDLLADLATMRARLDDIRARIRAGRAFGARATALRRLGARLVADHFDDRRIYGVSFAEAFKDLECVDVKVEAGRVSGAASCAKRLARLVEEKIPPPPPITFGSDLTGDPVAIPGVYQDDTEFWTTGLTVPADGLVTTFRLRIGSDPIDLPIRFSVVRPQPSGQVMVITTTDPPYPLPGGSPGTYTFSTSTLNFKCCRARKGDIVTVDNSGAGRTQDPYVWFARKSGFTTFSHTAGGDSQAPGNLWTGTPHEGYDTLLQVVVQPD